MGNWKMKKKWETDDQNCLRKQQVTISFHFSLVESKFQSVFFLNYGPI